MSTIQDDLTSIAGAWQDLTRYAKPIIQHVRLGSPGGLGVNPKGDGAITLFADTHTLEIGHGCASDYYPGFWNDLKEFGPQLKTIRFEIPEETEQYQHPEDEYVAWGGKLLDSIQELVVHRFEHGRPFSAVERMVVNQNERVNRQQDFVWRLFYNDRRLDDFVRRE